MDIFFIIYALKKSIFICLTKQKCILTTENIIYILINNFIHFLIAPLAFASNDHVFIFRHNFTIYIFLNKFVTYEDKIGQGNFKTRVKYSWVIQRVRTMQKLWIKVEQPPKLALCGALTSQRWRPLYFWCFVIGLCAHENYSILCSICSLTNIYNW